MQTSDQINLAIAIATSLSVIASLVVAALTWHIAKSNRLTAQLMQAQIEAASRPYIQIGPSVRIGTPLLQLSIKNTGKSNAENLRLELSQNFYFNDEASEDGNLKTFTAFVHPISTFPPDTALVFDLGIGSKIHKNSERCPQKFSIKATYESFGKKYSESTEIDLQPFLRTSVPHEPIADELEKVHRNLDRINSTIAAIVNSRDS